MKKHTLNALSLSLALAFAGAVSAEDDKPGEGANEPQPKAEPTVDDARREAQIWTSFAFNPHLKASDISVEVRGDRAYLTGTVDESTDKNLAGQIAQGVDGIATVENKLVVDENWTPKARDPNDTDRDFATTVEDATITASVKSKLLWNDHTDGLEIDVDTVDGRVTLTGTADTAEAKQIATRLARNTDGVVGVDNKLTLDTNRAGEEKIGQADEADDDDADDKVVAATDGDPDTAPSADVTDGWITTKVKSTLLLSRWVDGTDIDVDTKDGAVTLTGVAESQAEHDLAIELARDIKGVKSVDAKNLKVGIEEGLAGVEDDAD